MKIDISKLDEKMTLREVIIALGGKIEELPVMGETVSFQGGFSAERDIRDKGDVAIRYEWAHNGNNRELTRIYIGHRLSGPMLSCSHNGKEWVWHNLYSNDNYGRNWAAGGTWYSPSRYEYASAGKALVHRNYQVIGLDQLHNKAWTESSFLIGDVIRFINEFEN